MTPRKAVITAANPAEQGLPLQTITDSRGNTKAALQIVLDEIVEAGIEDIAVVIVPGSEETYRRACGPHASSVSFIEQHEPQGFGHAILQARDFTSGEPFLLLVGDHLFLSHSNSSCIRQLLDAAATNDGPMSAVQSTHESKLHLYGTVGANRIAGSKSLFQVHQIIEKPSPTLAEQELVIPGLRHGNYLCFFGMHVMPPRLMDLLDEAHAALPDGSNLDLTGSLASLVEGTKYLAVELDGTRFNLGERYGLLRSQVALGLAGPHRDEVLTALVELLAQRHEPSHDQ